MVMSISGLAGGADGNRDWVWIRNARDDRSLDANLEIRTHDLATLGFWGPQAHTALGHFIDPDEIGDKNLPFGTARELRLRLPGGTEIPVWAARISYVGELGWELYFENDPAGRSRLLTMSAKPLLIT